MNDERTQPDLSQMIGKIMSNPEFGNLVNQLKESGLTENAPSQPSSPPSEEQAKEELSKKLPDLMGMLTQSGLSTDAVDSAKIQKAVGALKKLDNRNCEKLLCALKPYLNSQRGEVIDKAMSMMKVTDILNLIQQTGQNGGK